MRPIASAFAALLALLPPASAGAASLTYKRPVPAPDPAAQLAEMVALFDQICLKAFPDEAAVARAMAARRATAMTAAEVKVYLHEDPGAGWDIAGRSAPFALTVEAPPFHACGVRTTAVAPFADMGPYRRLADGFEAGRQVQRIGPVNGTIGNVDTSGSGDMWKRPDGKDEALLVFIATPVARLRAQGEDAVQIRFVHQLVDPPSH
jgi:hypothetical protein